MFCYSVYHENKQLKVFAYSPTLQNDRIRAENLAFDMAKKAKLNGYEYSVEHFGACDVGVIVY